MEDSVFTKIINGELPCHKVYEDVDTIAFLSINPIVPGHTLIVPKQQVDQLWDLPEASYLAVMAASKKVANRIREILQPVRVGEHVEGLEVPHAHVHVFPFDTSEQFWSQPAGVSPPTEELAAMAARLRMEDAV